MTLTPAQTAWIDRARDADIVAVAQRSPINAKLKKQSREWIGPCPACGGTDRFAINPHKKGGVFVCRSSGGGDVIAMVRHVVGCDFLAACEIINGEPMPTAESKVSAADIKAAAEKREAERQARDAEREAEQDRYRQRMRESAYAIWSGALPFRGSPAETYLREHRGIKDLPEAMKLRFAPDLAFCHGEETDPAGRKIARVIHRGPAMLAPIVDAVGKFKALHRTYLDLDQPDGKARIIDPDTTEPINASKKTLGSKQGNAIRLVQLTQLPDALVIGEGIETVLSVWYACHYRDRNSIRATAFWAAVDLGNLAGKHAGTVPHPTRKSRLGRPERIAGPEPDLTEPGIQIPDSVTDVLILGDGDSDRFMTQCALHRAQLRFARPGRTVRCAWAPTGEDFNDLVRAV